MDPHQSDDIQKSTNGSLYQSRDSTHAAPLIDTVSSTGREVIDFKNFDCDLLKMIDGTQTFKSQFSMRLEIAIQLLVLLNSITTILVIIVQFVNRVPDEVQYDFGKTKFEALKNTLIIVPLTFFLIVVLMVNNFYSQGTFYYYIQRGAVIDFPETAPIKFLFTRPAPLLFIVVLLGYTGVVSFMMNHFQATTGQIMIVVSNLFIGVGYRWYRQQSIEDKFVTISQFLQKFPDSSGNYDNMDSHSLDLASHAMTEFTLLKTDGASYGNTMRHRWWKEKSYSTGMMILINVAMGIGILGLAGASFGFYLYQIKEQELKRWNDNISPCIRACQVGYLMAKGENINISGSGNTSEVADASKVVDETCTFCTCSCLRRFYLRNAVSLCNNALAKAKNDDSGFNSELSCMNQCPTSTTCNVFPWYAPSTQE